MGFSLSSSCIMLSPTLGWGCRGPTLEKLRKTWRHINKRKMKWKGGQTAPKGKQFMEEGHTALLRCPHQGLHPLLHWARPAWPCYTTTAYVDSGRNRPSHPTWWNRCKFDAETAIVADRHGDSWSQPPASCRALKPIPQLLNLIHCFSKPTSRSSTTATALLFWHARSKNSAELRGSEGENLIANYFFPTLCHFVHFETRTWGKARDADGLCVAARSVTWRTEMPHASPPPASRSLQHRCRWGAEGSTSLGTSS